ncbi:VOC family protein [Roseivirga sp. E12]|uniref:VOC family protein n=1 Tax=Roseivirga sp. E12 TaxID=2819237 RepID=UPI001ABCEAA0|nr:VOC family protein [Roseivirga sp. E12]MBO3700255.1 VOC family protein [Roseivirga sp. E12]
MKMKYLILMLILVSTLGCQEPKQELLSPRFNHVFLAVSDLDRSIDFYTSAFDLEVTKKLTQLIRIDEDGARTPVEVNMAFLKFPGQNFVLEIGEREAFVSNNTSSSYNHLGVDVMDIDKASARLLAAGGTAVRPIGLVEAVGVSAKTAFFTGPDGETIELMQLISGEF